MAAAAALVSQFVEMAPSALDSHTHTQELQRVVVILAGVMASILQVAPELAAPSFTAPLVALLHSLPKVCRRAPAPACLGAFGCKPAGRLEVLCLACVHGVPALLYVLPRGTAHSRS